MMKLLFNCKKGLRMALAVALLFSVMGAISAQAVTGTIVDQTGIGIPGVNVIQVGTTNGTVTDIDGAYSVTMQEGSDVLRYSFLGFSSVDETVAGRSQINVTLGENAQALEEVVVIGYGTQKKVNLTGAIGTASGEVLENRPISNVGQGLQGVVAGLNVSVPNGDPNGNVEFNIRGFTSINGGDPLILVDNIPMDINRINPNDIASVSVLKDAAASAIYGARAAFGVILITTKKGQEGKVKVTFSTEQALSSPIFHIDPILDPLTYVTNWNIASQADNGNPTYDQNFVDGVRRYSENPTQENEWGVFNNELRFYGSNNYQERLVTDFTPQRKYDMSISGATNGTSYYASVGYFTKDGYLAIKDANEKFERLNALLKVNFKINDWLSLEEKVIYNNIQQDNPHNYGFNANLNSIQRITPLEPLEFPDLPFYLEEGDREEYEQFIGAGFASSFSAIPYLTDGGRDRSERHEVWLSQGLTATPFDGFVIQANFASQFEFRTQQNVASLIDLVNGVNLTNTAFDNGESNNDNIGERQNYNQNYVFNAYAKYDFTLGIAHNLSAQVGYNQELYQGKQVTAGAQTLLSPIITQLDATTGVQNSGGNAEEQAIRGAFFRFNYNFNERYLFEVNGRYDGTSRFPKADRFGFFPSFSAAWRISEESFMSGTRDWLDNLKIRASYGELGNQTVLDNSSPRRQLYYPYIPSLSSGNSDFVLNTGQTSVVRPPGLVSPSLTWESVGTRNIGIDISLLASRIDFSFDIYTRDTKDMLLGVSRPDILGASPPRENGADLRTKGWELSVLYRDKIRNSVDFSLQLALADNTSRITRYDNPTGNIRNFYVGQELGEIFGYQTEGIFQSQEEIDGAPDHDDLSNNNVRPGDIRFTDLNGDGVIDQGLRTLDSLGDFTRIGNETARYSFGVTPTIKWKGITVSAFFQGLFRDFLPDAGNWGTFYPYQSGFIHEPWLNDSWSPENRDAYFPRPIIRDTRNFAPQSRYVQNAAYVRLKNLTLGYQVPRTIISKVGLAQANIYLSGLNLWEYTPMRKPLDPEQVGTRFQQYYFERTVSMGLNVTF
ncbi:SusC/RagA family TonB-linked outer membrane protein [Neolewinella antarctica]|uniref:TonB-linked SusC/RagA family outer membrane protein n=1 Tax=Neolewinella antarctica TaxID=442734 RepID=A0ABX0XAP2_9BACT|nr:TonB-dependent receptor [Neolewinella antarctica]NJC26310.1 TonB-linked SusC/RagA family outer membrane protein [Neolewinella antarctica]